MEQSDLAARFHNIQRNKRAEACLKLDLANIADNDRFNSCVSDAVQKAFQKFSDTHTPIEPLKQKFEALEKRFSNLEALVVSSFTDNTTGINSIVSRGFEGLSTKIETSYQDHDSKLKESMQQHGADMVEVLNLLSDTVDHDTFTNTIRESKCAIKNHFEAKFKEGSDAFISVLFESRSSILNNSNAGFKELSDQQIAYFSEAFGLLKDTLDSDTFSDGIRGLKGFLRHRFQSISNVLDQNVSIDNFTTMASRLSNSQDDALRGFSVLLGDMLNAAEFHEAMVPFTASNESTERCLRVHADRLESIQQTVENIESSSVSVNEYAGLERLLQDVPTKTTLKEAIDGVKSVHAGCTNNFNENFQKLETQISELIPSDTVQTSLNNLQEQIGDLTPSKIIEDKLADLHEGLTKVSVSAEIEEKLVDLHEGLTKVSVSAEIEEKLVDLHEGLTKVSVSAEIEEKLVDLQDGMNQLSPSAAIQKQLVDLHDGMNALAPSAAIQKQLVDLHDDMKGLSLSTTIEGRLTDLQEDINKLQQLTPSEAITQSLEKLHTDIQDLTPSDSISQSLNELKTDIQHLSPSKEISESLEKMNANLKELSPSQPLVNAVQELRTDIQQLTPVQSIVSYLEQLSNEINQLSPSEAIRMEIERVITSMKTLVPSSDINDSLEAIRDEIYTLTPCDSVIEIAQDIFNSMQTLCPTDDIYHSLNAISSQIRHLTPSDGVKVGLNTMSQKFTDLESSIQSYHSAHDEDVRNSSTSTQALATYMKERIDGETGISKSLLQLSQSDRSENILTKLEDLHQKVILLPQKDHIDRLISFAGTLIANKLDQLERDSNHHHTDLKGSLDTCMNTTMLKASACFDTLSHVDAVLQTTISQSLTSALDNRSPSCLKEEDIVAIIVEKLPVLIQDAFELSKTNMNVIAENSQEKLPTVEDITEQLKSVLSSELQQIHSKVLQHLSKQSVSQELPPRLMSLDDVRVIFKEYEVGKGKDLSSPTLVGSLSISKSTIPSSVDDGSQASPSTISSQAHDSIQPSQSNVSSSVFNNSQTSQSQPSNLLNQGVKNSRPSSSGSDRAYQTKSTRLDLDGKKSFINKRTPLQQLSWSVHDIGYASMPSSRKAPDKKLISSVLSETTIQNMIDKDLNVRKHRDLNIKFNNSDYGNPVICWLSQYMKHEGWELGKAEPKGEDERIKWWSTVWTDKDALCPCCQFRKEIGEYYDCFYFTKRGTIKLLSPNVVDLEEA